MDNLEKFYINGKWVTPKSSDKMSVLNPATEDKIGEIVLGNSEDVDHAVSAAKAAFSKFSITPKSYRLGLLKKIREISERRLDDLANAMTMEMGAPKTMAKDVQADAATGHLDGFIESLEKLEERISVENPEVIRDIFDKDQTILLVVGHFANWEWLLQRACITYKKPFDAVYQRLSNKKIDDLTIEFRSKFGGVRRLVHATLE